MSHDSIDGVVDKCRICRLASSALLNVLFIHLIAWKLPVMMFCALITSLNVPSPFFAIIRYFLMLSRSSSSLKFSEAGRRFAFYFETSFIVSLPDLGYWPNAYYSPSMSPCSNYFIACFIASISHFHQTTLKNNVRVFAKGESTMVPFRLERVRKERSIPPRMMPPDRRHRQFTISGASKPKSLFQEWLETDAQFTISTVCVSTSVSVVNIGLDFTVRLELDFTSRLRIWPGSSNGWQKISRSP